MRMEKEVGAETGWSGVVQKWLVAGDPPLSLWLDLLR